MFTVAFSWDDGAVEDLKLMDLYLKFNIPCIFFVPAINPERAVISEDEIKIIADNFEIGSHTYSHIYLTKIPLKVAEEELIRGKDFLEQLLGKELPHFCFPGGKYNSDLLEVSKKYFLSARTADTGALFNRNSYLVKPTFHFYDRGKKSLVFNSLRNTSDVFILTLKNLIIRDYFELITKMIDDLAKQQGNNKILIWGHSWEIEKFELWSRLEIFLKYLNNNYPQSIKRYSDLLNFTG